MTTGSEFNQHPLCMVAAVDVLACIQPGGNGRVAVWIRVCAVW